MEPDAIEIERITSPDALRQVQTLHEEIWGLEAMDVIPMHLYAAVVRNGGMALVAYAEKQPAGYVFGFIGRQAEEAYFYTHNLGVLRAYRGRGIAFRLKMRLAREAAAQRLHTIQWTFDPLDSRNAHIYLTKLGAQVTEYIPDYYGQMHDDLNKGLVSDRLAVAWDIRQVNPHHPPAGNSATSADIARYEPLNETFVNDSGHLEMSKQQSPVRPEGGRYKIRIPTNFPEMKKACPEAAMERMAYLQHTLKACYEAGLEVSGCFYHGREFYYLLEKQKPPVA